MIPKDNKMKTKTKLKTAIQSLATDGRQISALKAKEVCEKAQVPYTASTSVMVCVLKKSLATNVGLEPS